jgi:hypothetical protein
MKGLTLTYKLHLSFIWAMTAARFTQQAKPLVGLRGQAPGLFE